MRFNSLFIGSSNHVLIPVRRLMAMQLAAGQRVIYVGDQKDWDQLMLVPMPARKHIIFVCLPDSGNLTTTLTLLHELSDTLTEQLGMGAAIYIKPAMPGLDGLIHKWVEAHGISVHLILKELADLTWLSSPLYKEAFQFKCAFLWGKEADVVGISDLIGTKPELLRQVWGLSASLTAVRFDGMARLVDVGRLMTTRINKQLAQLRAALPIIMPGLMLQHIPLGLYPLTDMLHAVTRIYLESPERLTPELFICYGQEDIDAYQLAAVWRTTCHYLDEFYFVLLPPELTLWPFNLIGAVVDPVHCLWWRNEFSGWKEEERGHQIGRLGGIRGGNHAT